MDGGPGETGSSAAAVSPAQSFLLAPGSGKKPSVDPDCTYRNKSCFSMRPVSSNVRFLTGDSSPKRGSAPVIRPRKDRCSGRGLFFDPELPVHEQGVQLALLHTQDSLGQRGIEALRGQRGNQRRLTGQPCLGR